MKSITKFLAVLLIVTILFTTIVPSLVCAEQYHTHFLREHSQLNEPQDSAVIQKFSNAILLKKGPQPYKSYIKSLPHGSSQNRMRFSLANINSWIVLQKISWKKKANRMIKTLLEDETDFLRKKYFKLTQDQKQSLRNTFKSTYEKNGGAQNGMHLEELFGRMVMAAKEFQLHQPLSPDDTVAYIGEGRSVWIVETAKLMDIYPERYKRISFSQLKFRLNFLYKNKLGLEKAILSYKEYLERIGLNPKSILNKKGKTIIVIDGSERLNIFLENLAIIAEQEGVDFKKLAEKIATSHWITSVDSIHLTQFFKLGPHEISSSIQKIESPLDNTLRKHPGFSGALGTNIPLELWHKIPLFAKRLGETDRLTYLYLLDYLNRHKLIDEFEPNFKRIEEFDLNEASQTPNATMLFLMDELESASNKEKELEILKELDSLTENANFLNTIENSTLSRLIFLLIQLKYHSPKIDLSHRATSILYHLEPRYGTLSSNIFAPILLTCMTDPTQDLNRRIDSARTLLDYSSILRSPDFSIKRDNLPLLQSLASWVESSPSDDVGRFFNGIVLLKAWYDSMKRVQPQENQNKERLTEEEKQEYLRIFKLAENIVSQFLLQNRTSLVQFLPYHKEKPTLLEFKPVLEETMPAYILMILGVSLILESKLMEATHKLSIPAEELSKIREIFKILDHYLKEENVIVGETKTARAFHHKIKESLNKISFRYASLFKDSPLHLIQQTLWRNKFLTGIGNILIRMSPILHWMIQQSDQIKEFQRIWMNFTQLQNPNTAKIMDLMDQLKSEQIYDRKLKLGYQLIDHISESNYLSGASLSTLKSLIYFGLELSSHEDKYLETIGHGVFEVISNNITLEKSTLMDQWLLEVVQNSNRDTKLRLSAAKILQNIPSRATLKKRYQHKRSDEIGRFISNILFDNTPKDQSYALLQMRLGLKDIVSKKLKRISSKNRASKNELREALQLFEWLERESQIYYFHSDQEHSNTVTKMYQELKDSIHKLKLDYGSILLNKDIPLSRMDSLKEKFSTIVSNVTLIFKRYILPSVMFLFITQRALAFDGQQTPLEWASILQASLFIIFSSLIVIHLGNHQDSSHPTPQKNISYPHKFWIFFGTVLTLLIFNPPVFAKVSVNSTPYFSNPTQQTTQLMSQMQTLLGTEAPLLTESGKNPTDLIVINDKDLLEDPEGFMAGLKGLIEKLGDSEAAELLVTLEDNEETRMKITGILKDGEFYSKLAKVSFTDQTTDKNGKYSLKEILANEPRLTQGDYTLWVLNKHNHWLENVQELLKTMVLRSGLDMIQLDIRGIQATAVSQ